MKHQKFRDKQVIQMPRRLLLIVLSLSFGVAPLASYGQSYSARDKTKLARSSKKNSELQYSLKWSLGRKAQRGWYLYVPLLQKTLNTESKPNTVEFAGSVMRWQKARGIFPNGVINSSTLYSFIKFWQSKRLKPIVLAREDQLITAPIREFYDPTRDSALLKVEKETYDSYRRMLKAAIDDPTLKLRADESGRLLPDEKFLTLVSTYRSPKYQASLRRKQPGASRAQIAFKSPHFTGRALDIYVGGEPVTTLDFNRGVQVKTPVYRWLVKNAERFGFYNYFYEPWHWEYAPKKEKAAK
ncbi:MAG: DUF882 domain-containing protein [Pyrinomonadaceae bacterium]|nr:DUF882 domain-containing protein [Pyrinomonadaceae bacterium]